MRSRVDKRAAYVLRRCQENGYQSAASRDDDSGSGIVSLRKEGVDDVSVSAQLAGKGISVASRAGWIRVAAHFYNTEDEIDRLGELLP